VCRQLSALATSNGTCRQRVIKTPGKKKKPKKKKSALKKKHTKTKAGVNCRPCDWLWSALKRRRLMRLTHEALEGWRTVSRSNQNGTGGGGGERGGGLGGEHRGRQPVQRLCITAVFQAALRGWRRGRKRLRALVREVGGEEL